MQESLVGCSQYFTNYVSYLRTTSVYLEIIVEVIEFWCLSSNLRLLEPCNVLKISFFCLDFTAYRKNSNEMVAMQLRETERAGTCTSQILLRLNHGLMVGEILPQHIL